MSVDKKKALETALAQIEKQFGKGSVMRLGENSSMNVDAIPTGSLTLDLALGIGGLSPGPHRRNLRAGEPRARRRCPSTWSAECPKAGRRGRVYRRGARAGPGLRDGRWAWISTAFWSPSRIPASRRWRSRRPWCKLRRYRRGRGGLGGRPGAADGDSRARWATLSSACRRG